MNEIVTIMTDMEFEKYLGHVQEFVDEAKAKRMGHYDIYMRIIGYITASSEKEKQEVFTAGQLRRIFDLAN